MLENVEWREIWEQREAARKGEKGAIIKDAAEDIGVSEAVIYANLRKFFHKKKDVVRKKKIPDSLIREVAKIKMYLMKLHIDEREFSTKLCIGKLINKGVEGADKLVVSTVNRRLEENGFRMRDAIVRVEASYANQEHQMDFTRSKYFQLWKRDGQEWILRCSGKELHYKQGDYRLRTWIVSLTDSFSRVEISRAYPATNESVNLGIEFLRLCYNRDEDDHLLRSLPDRIKFDQGSFSKPKMIKEMFERLNMDFKRSRPYSKRGIQKVESAHRRRWQQFELSLAYDIGEGKTISLTDYNDLLYEKCIEDMGRRHPVREDTCENLYRASLVAHPPRYLDADLREVAFWTTTRTVRDTLLVSINNQAFRCPEGTQGKTIRIFNNMMGEFVGEVIEDYGKPFVLEAVKGYVELDDYEHRPKQSYRQEIETEVEREMREERKTKNGERRTENEEPKKGKRLFIEPVGERVKPDTVFDEVMDEAGVFSSAYRAKAYIGRRLMDGYTYADYADIFDELLRDDLSRGSIDLVLDAINNQALAL